MARAVDVAINPNDPDQMLVLREDGWITAKGGVALPPANPIVRFAFGNRAIKIQVIDWGIGGSPTSGYVCDARGHAYAWGSAVPVPTTQQPNFGGTGLGTFSVVDFSMDPAGNGDGWAIDNRGHMKKIGTPPPTYFPTYANLGLGHNIVRAWDTQWGLFFHAVIVTGQGLVQQPADLGTHKPTTWPYYRSLDIVRDLVWDFDNERGHMIDGYGVIWPVGGSTETLLPAGYFPGRDVVEAFDITNWGTGRAVSVTLVNGSAIATAVTPAIATFFVGQGIAGPGIPDGTTVVSTSGNTITLSAAATSTGVQSAVLGDGSALRYRTLTYDGVLRDGIYTSPPEVYITSPAGTNEVQRLQITGSPSAGTYRLTFAGQQTAPIAWNADAEAIGAALLALSNISDGDIVSIDLTATRTWSITFGGRYSGLNVGQMTVSNSITSGTAVVTTLVQGAKAIVTDTTKPEISWVYNDRDNDVQQEARVRVYKLPPGGATASWVQPPSEWNGPPVTWTELVVSSSVRSVRVGKPLANGSYRAYVRARERNGVLSAWDYYDFDISVVLPAAPTVLAASDPDDAANELLVSTTYTGDTVLRAERRLASLADVDENWSPVRANEAPATKVVVFDSFNRADSSSLGSTEDVSSLGRQVWRYDSDLPVAITSNKAGTTSRVAYVSDINADIRGIEATGLQFNTADAASLVTLLFNYTSPLAMSKVVALTARGDGVVLLHKYNNGTATLVATPLASGFSGALRMEVDGTTVRVYTGGVLRGSYTVPELGYEAGTIDAIDGTAYGFFTVGTTTRIDSFSLETEGPVVRDYEAVPGETYVYNVWIANSDGSIEGPKTLTDPVITPLVGWWLKDPLYPERNTDIATEGDDFEWSHTARQGVFDIEDSPYPVVITGVVGAARFSRVLIPRSESQYKAIQLMMDSGHTLLLQSPLSRQWFCQLGESRTHNELMIYTSEDGIRLRTIAVDVIEVARPAVEVA